MSDTALNHKKPFWKRFEFYLGVSLAVFFTYAYLSQSTTPVKSDEDTAVSKPDKASTPSTRLPETNPKFIKPEQVKIKPQADQSIKSNTPAADKGVSEELTKEVADLLEKGYGTIPPVSTKENLNPQKKSVIEALETGKHPERLSIVGKRETFDLDKYLQDPSAYLNVSVPSRCFEAAQPGEGVPILKRVSPQYIEMYQDETVDIVVEGIKPGYPATISSFDSGSFENDLSSQTLKANSSGSVAFRFTPGQGVIHNTRLAVASPLSSGVIRFNVFVKKTKEISKTNNEGNNQ